MNKSAKLKILNFHEGEVKDLKILKNEDFHRPESSKILDGPNMDFTHLGIYKEELVGPLAYPRSLFFTKYIMIMTRHVVRSCWPPLGLSCTEIPPSKNFDRFVFDNFPPLL